MNAARVIRFAEFEAHVSRHAQRTKIFYRCVCAEHGAHQAVAIDRLMTAGLARDWAICGVGLLEAD